jgi:hypothetical protein
MSDEKEGSYVGSTSGFYQARPSIARYIEAAVANLASPAGTFEVRLGVLSENMLYADAQGSIVGVFVVTAIPAAIGAQARLDVQLPWGEVMELTGTVEWILDVPRISLRHRPGMGVRFDLEDSQRALLNRSMVLREPMVVPADVRRR